MRNSHCLLFFILVLSLVGCGGGNNGGSPSLVSTGRAVLTIRWPRSTRLLPAAANSIKVEITRGTTVVGNQLAVRPSSGDTTTLTFDVLPVGDLVVTAIAYPQTDGTGTAQAKGTVPLKIQGNANTAFTLTMGTTIDHLELTASGVSFRVGTTRQLNIAAKDASGAVVLLAPAKLQWRSSTTGIVSVDSNGSATGVSVGAADITVTDTESGKKATITITVSLTPPITFQTPIVTNVAHPSQIVAADLDGDGKMDLVVGTTNGSLFVFYGKGDGTLEPAQTVVAWSGYIAPQTTADLNGDGKLDLICTVDTQIFVLHNLGARHFATPIAIPVGGSAGTVVAADFDGDGRKDMAAVVYNHPGSAATDIVLYKNSGSGNYTKVNSFTSIWYIGRLRTGDINNDGKTDLIVSMITNNSGTSGATLYYGDGAFNFTSGPSIGTGTFNVYGIAVADLNSDGRLDFIVGNTGEGSIAVVTQQSDGSFKPPAYYATQSADFLATPDMDGDGAPEIIVENTNQFYFTVMKNEGGLFPHQTQVPLSVSCGPLVTADMNGDGKPDVALISDSNALVVVLNNTP